MSKPTNDEMHEILTLFYGPNKTLGDMLTTYFAPYGGESRATRQYEWYDETEAEGFTVGDISNDYWSDIEYLFSNLEWEDGTNCLMEDNILMGLEVGN